MTFKYKNQLKSFILEKIKLKKHNQLSTIFEEKKELEFFKRSNQASIFCEKLKELKCVE